MGRPRVRLALVGHLCDLVADELTQVTQVLYVAEVRLEQKLASSRWDVHFALS